MDVCALHNVKCVDRVANGWVVTLHDGSFRRVSEDTARRVQAWLDNQPKEEVIEW